MTATLSEQHPETTVPEQASGTAPHLRSRLARRQRPAEPGPAEPLLRLDATVRDDPEARWPGTPLRRLNTFRLQREEQVQRLLRRREAADALSAAGAEDTDGRRPTELATLREERRQVTAVARLVCQATMETLAGQRPVQQLERWLDPGVFDKVRERAELLAHARRVDAADDAVAAARGPLSLKRLRCCGVSRGVWEVAVVFAGESRTRACAMRLEAHRGRWRVVALELG
ncbi:Rv3235 family protein [Nesterenkonia sp. CL21]|uniref:Rv3235 family protein n=1 Tax=Nesterenkonia sp. CL21 TaxID=3064894 RepID=UPI002878D087|nr:Rv3235 family protein [Nesterenkonia sp. CL21]MDS2171202.1 Rv3235 family protein [Nesterenkonia sp. CL21]